MGDELQSSLRQTAAERELARSWKWYAAGGAVLLMGAVLFVALVARMLAGTDPLAGAEDFPPIGPMPAGFASDNSPEATAFRETCIRCHTLPSPSIHDAAGWQVVRGKMAAQMAARGLRIPDRQIDLAIAYATRHARGSNPPSAP